MSRRQEQFSSVLRNAIQAVIDRGIQDPRISGMITVTEVRVAEDFADATILISVLPAERQELTLHGIRSATMHIRREAGKNVDSRKLPRFHFDLDSRTKKQAAVIDALLKVQHDRESPGFGSSEHPARSSEEPPPLPSTDPATPPASTPPPPLSAKRRNA
ncbi:MAG: 30S ribosome-binding factor RbfA [Phycisphaeraceae bacterium]|nr:30S ribosome-binding factor RbfA [Phycisphaeraceae bacterium]